MKSNKVLIMLAFFLIVILPFISSAQPTQVSTNTMQIEYPKYDILKQNTDHRFHVHVINDTSLMKSSTTSCYLHVYNQTGYDIQNIPTQMEFEVYNGLDFALTINGGNFSTIGVYSYVVQCNSTSEAAFASGQLHVTPNGVEADTGNAIFYLGLLSVLIVFLIFSLYIFMSIESLLSRVGMFGISYLLLIAITFIGWNMASDFITSAPFLISMLRILFMVLLVGLFPLLIASFAFYFLQMTKIKEIERLMTKGFSLDEAERRVSR